MNADVPPASPASSSFSHADADTHANTDTHPNSPLSVLPRLVCVDDGGNAGSSRWESTVGCGYVAASSRVTLGHAVLTGERSAVALRLLLRHEMASHPAESVCVTPAVHVALVGARDAVVGVRPQGRSLLLAARRVVVEDARLQPAMAVLLRGRGVASGALLGTLYSNKGCEGRQKQRRECAWGVCT